MKNYGILGAGAWGTSISTLIHDGRVNIWTRNKKIVKLINTKKINPYLKNVKLPPNLRATENLNDLKNCDHIFIALPAQKIKNILMMLKKILIPENFIICSKGIDMKNNKLLSEIVSELFPKSKIAILSGPCFANEVAQKKPTAVILSIKNRKSFDKIKNIISKKYFRIYYNNDLVGSQLGGSIKNVYAIGAGIIKGLNLGENAQSAYISRSFAEILRLGKKMKAKEKTFFGLSGLGDLILTCNSKKSRNTFFGLSIVKFKKKNINNILMSKKTITEGYYTSKALFKLSKKYKIEMPISNSIYKILYKKADIQKEINLILSRSLKKEFY